MNKQLSKTVKWIKDGESVPLDAKYLKTEPKIVGYEENCHPMFNDIPVWADFHLYEIIVYPKLEETK